jgi:hypothetical protein
MAHLVGLPKLSRRPRSTVPIDTATAAIALPGVFSPDQEQNDVENTAGAVVAFAGMDGSYGLYDVVDGTAVVGVEVVIHSPEGEKAFEAFLDQELGWRPDVEFWGRCGRGALSEDEKTLYDRYLGLVSTYSYFVEGAVVEHDPSGAASLVTEIPVPDGVLEVGDPYCEMRRVSVSPGTYRLVVWQDEDASGKPLGTTALRIGAYRADLGRAAAAATICGKVRASTAGGRPEPQLGP